MPPLPSRTVAVVVLVVAAGFRVSPHDPLVDIVWRCAVLVLAALGTIRLTGRARGDDGWTPRLAAILYAVGPVMVAVSLASPLDALVAATLPWLASGSRSDTTRSWPWWALWLAPAGLASPPWAVAAVAVAVVAAVVRWARTGAVPWRVLLIGAIAGAWWWAPALSTSATGSAVELDLADAVARTAGLGSDRVGWAVAALAWAPLGVLLAGSRERDHDLVRRGWALALVGAGLGLWPAIRTEWVLSPIGPLKDLPSSWLPDPALAAGAAAPAAAVMTLAGACVLARRMASVRPGDRPSTPVLVIAGALTALAALGFLIAVHERGYPAQATPRLDSAIAGFSTQT